MHPRPGGQPAPSVVPPSPIDPIAGLEAIGAELERLPALSIAQQVEVFSGIHQQLTAALAVTGNQPGPAPSSQQSSGYRPGSQHSSQLNGNLPATPLRQRGR